MLAYQKFNIPTDGLFIVLSPVTDQEIARESNLEVQQDSSEAEVFRVLALHEIQIDVMSFDDQARLRRLEIPMAMSSIYSEQKQEENAIQIARNMSPMINTSFLELSKNLSRYTTRVKLTAVTTLVHGDPNYYSNFRGQLNVDPLTEPPITVDPAPAKP